MRTPVEARPIRIVLVDDSPEVRELMRIGLSDVEGLSVVGEAADGAEAMAVVQAIIPDVVLLDVAMPRMDGLAVLEAIRSLYGDSVKVVMWSGFSAPHLAARAIDLGASAYIEKSGDIDPVVAALRRAGRREDRSNPTVAQRRPELPLPVESQSAGTQSAGTQPASATSPAVRVPDGHARSGSNSDNYTFPPLGPGLRAPHPTLVYVSVVLLFAGIAIWRSLDSAPADRVADLYVIPVLLMAVQSGARGALASAAVASGLFVAYANGQGLGLLPYMAQVLTYVVSGLLVGLYSDQARRVSALRDRDRYALAAANRRLAESVARSRTANADLAATNADLRQFMHVASHDLAEPLRTMSGFAQLVADRYGDQVDAKGQEFLGHVVDGAARMQSLLDGLLLYTRASQQDLRQDDVDLTAVVRGVCTALGAAIRDSGATVEVSALPKVPGDATMLGLVFQNLISNAIKFHTGRPAVTVTGRTEGEWAVVAVSDDGIGIAPEHQTRVFDLFRRLHTRSEYPGTGLGLAICRRVIDRHGGTIAVDSRPGGGTTFTISLPSRTPDDR